MTDRLQLSQTPMSRPPRIQIQLSEQSLRLLTLWSAFHGRPVGTFASQIVSTGIEAHIDVIDNLIRKSAETNGITYQEQIERWLDENNNGME